LRAGQPEAFEAVYREHVSEVMTLLLRGFLYGGGPQRRFMRVNSDFDAEEICQEAFARFFRQCIDGKFDPTRPIAPYLKRIAANVAVTRVGRVSREVLVDEPVLADEVTETRPEDLEFARLYDEFQRGLSENEKAVLQGCVQDGKSQSAVAAEVGLSRDQVYRVLTAVRGAARRFFARRRWFDDD